MRAFHRLGPCPRVPGGYSQDRGYVKEYRYMQSCGFTWRSTCTCKSGFARFPVLPIVQYVHVEEYLYVQKRLLYKEEYLYVGSYAAGGCDTQLLRRSGVFEQLTAGCLALLLC